MGIFYATREDVKSAAGSNETARDDAGVDRAVDSASRSIEGLTHRRFYPEQDTRTLTVPANLSLWLGTDELAELPSTVTSDGVAVSDYDFEPTSGPPFTRLVIGSASDLTDSEVTIAGLFGYSAEEESVGTLAEALDASETAVDVSDSAAIGIGNIIKVDSERMIVTGKTMLTTGQTLQTPLTASNANVTVAVTTGSSFVIGETILLDSERMLVVDIAGNNLTVKRAQQGSVLAIHAGSTIYAPRTLTVVRFALGTTAATHSTSAPITKHVVPALVRSLAIAEAMNTLAQESSGYARTIGSGDNERPAGGGGLDGLREQVYTRYGRKVRMGVV